MKVLVNDSRIWNVRLAVLDTADFSLTRYHVNGTMYLGGTDASVNSYPFSGVRYRYLPTAQTIVRLCCCGAAACSLFDWLYPVEVSRPAGIPARWRCACRFMRSRARTALWESYFTPQRPPSSLSINRLIILCFYHALYHRDTNSLTERLLTS